MSDQAIDAQRIDQLFRWQLDEFEHHFEDHPVPIEQDLRAGAIAWIATFASEAVGESSRAHLKRTRHAAYQFPDFAHHGWYRVPYLDVAAFALTGQRDLLDTVIDNLDHHSSQLRADLHAPLALIADRLSWADERFKERIASNLRKSHFFNDSLLCLCCAIGSASREKAAELLVWREHLSLAPQDREALDKLLKGDFLSNSLIVGEVLQVSLWVLSLFSVPSSPVRIDAVQADLFELRAKNVTVSQFWRRMSAHRAFTPLARL